VWGCLDRVHAVRGRIPGTGMSDLYHECRNGYAVKLELHPLKTPYAGEVDEYGMRLATEPKPVSHFENWGCKICDHHTMRLVESYPNLRVPVDTEQTEPE